MSLDIPAGQETITNEELWISKYECEWSRKYNHFTYEFTMPTII